MPSDAGYFINSKVLDGALQPCRISLRRVDAISLVQKRILGNLHLVCIVGNACPDLYAPELIVNCDTGCSNSKFDALQRDLLQ
jgi:hypothetical protein